MVIKNKLNANCIICCYQSTDIAEQTVEMAPAELSRLAHEHPEHYCNICKNIGDKTINNDDEAVLDAPVFEFFFYF